ncbi:uncharacterized protein APUU_60318S [Aspergillus puulaauensis]|uniref:Uncharacterized protein n=1 Tax=Aspergillus puulaauensis TaxID=1220207 RepID=A0A7R7XT58_9EURO|nr:uncharacterized protein APUU_60318S [Aspergillus puulaauensis]BCS27270.1 hypothetical protein APUU_60318S [Aspergillus puulaauensis]
MSDESIKSPHQVPPTERAGRWTDEERYRLSYLRNLHSHLSWIEFHKSELNFFPNRSQIALYNEHHRMEKVNAKRRVQLPKDRSNASPLLKPKRPLVHDPSTSLARPDKQVRITIDDDESNDDDGDIQGDGQTKRSSHNRQEQSRLPDCPRKASLGSSGQALGPARQKMLYSPPSRPAPKASESPPKKSLACSPSASKPQPAKAPSPITNSATVSPITQSQPQNRGISVANNQPGQPALPQTLPHGESSGTAGCEVSDAINLSLAPRPAIQSGTTESAAVTSTAATATIPANTNTSTTIKQNKPPPTGQTNKPIPATEEQLISTPYKASNAAQCMISQSQSQWLTQTTQFVERENRARAEAECRLAFHIAVTTRGVENKLDQLREKIDAQGKVLESQTKVLDSQARVIDSQTKEIQSLQAEKGDAALRKEIDDLKNSGSEQLAALAKQIEGLKEDTQKIMKFQGNLHRAINDPAVVT